MTTPKPTSEARLDLEAVGRAASEMEAQRARQRMDPRQYDDGDLALNFPEFVWLAQQPLSRVHRSQNDPVHFATDGDGRFDPPDENCTFGTWYLSSHPTGAFVEVFGRTRTVRAEDIDDRTLTQVYLPSDVRLADFTHPSIVGRYGITNELSAGNPESTYPVTQQWAKALQRLGFAGIYYVAPHDVEVITRSVAIFGKPDDESFSDSLACNSQPLDLVAQEMMERYQFRIITGRPL